MNNLIDCESSSIELFILIIFPKWSVLSSDLNETCFPSVNLLPYFDGTATSSSKRFELINVPIFWPGDTNDPYVVYDSINVPSKGAINVNFLSLSSRFLTL